MAQGRGRPPQGSRSPGGPTLAQATGGRPGQVKPKAAPKSLGLGLGLGAKQRQGFQQAAQSGSSGQWLGNHPGVQQRIQQINPNSAMGGQQQQRIQQFMGTGQSQRMPRPPQGGPAGAQQMQPPPQAPLQMPQQQPFMGNFAQGTGDQLSPQKGYSGDNGSMQQQLGLMSGGGYGGQQQPMQSYQNMGQQAQGMMGGGFQRDPYQQAYQQRQQQPQQAPNWGGGMGYQGAIGGAGWMQQPTQQQLNPQRPPQGGYGGGGYM